MAFRSRIFAIGNPSTNTNGSALFPISGLYKGFGLFALGRVVVAMFKEPLPLISICGFRPDWGSPSHRRHRQNAPPAGSADAEAGAGRRGRKPRRHLRCGAVVEADPRRDRDDARRAAVLHRTGQGTPALGPNHRRRRSPRWITWWSRPPIPSAPRRSTARGWARHGARPLASGLGPADVLPLRRSHRRGRAPAGQGATRHATRQALGH